MQRELRLQPLPIPASPLRGSLWQRGRNHLHLGWAAGDDRAAGRLLRSVVAGSTALMAIQEARMQRFLARSALLAVLVLGTLVGRVAPAWAGSDICPEPNDT